MAIKNVFNTMKRGGYVIQPWEKYLLSKQDKNNDRAKNVNAPSQIGMCIRARYYVREGYPSERISAKTERIFNNGTYVHERIQKDLKSCGILLMDEVPVFDDEYLIQGHTDGIITLGNDELGILEIKSINSRNFTELKVAKEEHVEQGLCYLHCVEKHRKLLRASYKNAVEFAMSWTKERRPIYEAMYPHLQGGNTYSRQQKLDFQLLLHSELDRLLYYQDKPITKAVFLYECKDNQEVKEFVVDSTTDKAKDIIENILIDCNFLNESINVHIIPPRPEGAKRNSNMCRWCAYKDECFVV